jgi:hypothetical protein
VVAGGGGHWREGDYRVPKGEGEEEEVRKWRRGRGGGRRWRRVRGGGESEKG